MEFIEVLKFTKSKEGIVKPEPESFPVNDIKSFRRWDPDAEEKKVGARLCTKIIFHSGASITIAESYESFRERVGTRKETA